MGRALGDGCGQTNKFDTKFLIIFFISSALVFNQSEVRTVCAKNH